MDFTKKNFTLIIGILIPVLMIIFVGISIYLPGLFIQPKYSFLYISGSDQYYNSQYQYYIEKERLNRNTINDSENKPYLLKNIIKLYFYDVNKNENQEVSFDEAQNYRLDSNNISPDGFEVVNGNQSGGFFPLFFYSSRDYNIFYLKGHNASKKLNLKLNGSHYDNFRFIGWVK